MVRIIGNALAAYFLTIIFFVHAEVELHLRCENGQAADSVVVGQPLLLEVSVSDNASIAPQVTVDGLDQATIRYTGFQVTTINNCSTYTYTYHIVYDQPGKYQLGPAFLAHASDKDKSESVIVHVADSTGQVKSTPQTAYSKKSGVAKKAGKPKDSLDGVELLFNVDKTHVMAGERICCEICLLYEHDDLTLRYFGQETAFPLTPTNKKGPIKTKKQLNGKEYKCIQWSFALYPDKPGEYVMPIFYADIVRPDTNNMKVAHFFFGFMSERKKRVYANAVKITVEKLPDSVPADTIVGTFESLKMTLACPHIDQGQATTAQLELVGDANFDAITVESLAGLSNGLRCYLSEQHVDESASGCKAAGKTFVFVIQGLEPGTWQIPAQELVYFDVASQVLKTIATEPCQLKVSPVTTLQSSSCQALKAPDVDCLAQSESKGCPVELDELVLDGPITGTVQGWYMAWWLFYLLWTLPMVIPLCMIIGWALRRFEPTWRRYTALKRARKNLGLVDTNDYFAVYRIVIDFISDRMRVPAASITVETVEAYLRHAHVDDQKIDEWRNFWTMLYQGAFGKDSDMLHEKTLFFKTDTWLVFLGSL